jgi:hypothetical protein
MSDIYKFAAQNQLRFPSTRGELTVEDLFALPLKSPSGFDLDTVARTVNTELKSVTTESFVESPKPNGQQERLTVMLDIVKDVIKTKQDEAAAALAKQNRVVERRKILDAIAAQKDEKLRTSSIEDLEKKLAELD